jgi:hypothetical protein
MKKVEANGMSKSDTRAGGYGSRRYGAEGVGPMTVAEHAGPARTVRNIANRALSFGLRVSILALGGKR